jgi:hypothetical protein
MIYRSLDRFRLNVASNQVVHTQNELLHLSEPLLKSRYHTIEEGFYLKFG